MKTTEEKRTETSPDGKPGDGEPTTDNHEERSNPRKKSTPREAHDERREVRGSPERRSAKRRIRQSKPAAKKKAHKNPGQMIQKKQNDVTMLVGWQRAN